MSSGKSREVNSLSIRLKITLWFAAALFIVIAMTYAVILSVSREVIQKTVRDTLLETVENNVDEIEYYKDITGIDLNSETDHFIVYKDGYLEVDDDFLDEVNEVYTALYSSDGTLMYGENPLAMELAGMEFSDSVVRTRTVGGELFYIFDRELTGPGLDGLWLRGVVSELQGNLQMHEISVLSLIILPVILLVAIVGGYLIAGRMLRPINNITEAANMIGRGGDLKQRIEVKKGNDELHRLAESFNEMIGRLDAAFEAERQFTSDASHELRTPMSVIMAQCEYSLDETRTQEEYQNALGVIKRQGRKMSRLINDMLDFVRLERHSGCYAMEKTNLSELVSSVCQDMALIGEKGIKLSCIQGDNITACVCPELINRLLTNLISNAYRYGNENGSIKVELSEDEDCIRLSVADDGIGISEDEQELIFNRFYQSDSSRSGVGTGLGLTMVKEIASLHGGSVEVNSELGKGSVFTFVLPKKPEQQVK